MKLKDYQEKWPHLAQCDFPKPAKDGMVDILSGVYNADLHYSIVAVWVRIVDQSHVH